MALDLGFTWSYADARTLGGAAACSRRTRDAVYAELRASLAASDVGRALARCYLNPPAAEIADAVWRPLSPAWLVLCAVVCPVVSGERPAGHDAPRIRVLETREKLSTRGGREVAVAVPRAWYQWRTWVDDISARPVGRPHERLEGAPRRGTFQFFVRGSAEVVRAPDADDDAAFAAWWRARVAAYHPRAPPAD